MRAEFSSLKSGAASRTGELTIGDLARICDVSLRTLRFYEDKGLLHPRRDGTSRFYSAKDRVRLELILKGKRLGFTLAEIDELIASRINQQKTSSADEPSDIIRSLGSDQIEAQITHLQRQRGELDAAIVELQTALGRLHKSVG